MKNRPLHQVKRNWSPFSRMYKGTKEFIFKCAGLLLVSRELLELFRYDLEMRMLRLHNRFSLSHRRKIRDLQNGMELRINIGCGNDVLDGWINIDAFMPSINSDSVLLVDLRERLPLKDGSASIVYAEHLLEHFDRQQYVLPMLRDFHRVLKDGGVVRVIVPNAVKFMEAYFDDKHPLRSIFDADNWMEQINTIARDSGHKYMYDGQTLVNDLLKAGFREAYEVLPGQGKFPLIIMDNHDPVRRATSLYVEAIK
jgi:predicted SAM-dependent methyltransferase